MSNRSGRLYCIPNACNSTEKSVAFLPCTACFHPSMLKKVSSTLAVRAVRGSTAKTVCKRRLRRSVLNHCPQLARVDLQKPNHKVSVTKSKVCRRGESAIHFAGPHLSSMIAKPNHKVSVMISKVQRRGERTIHSSVPAGVNDSHFFSSPSYTNKSLWQTPLIRAYKFSNFFLCKKVQI